MLTIDGAGLAFCPARGAYLKLDHWLKMKFWYIEQTETAFYYKCVTRFGGCVAKSQDLTERSSFQKMLSLLDHVASREVIPRTQFEGICMNAALLTHPFSYFPQDPQWMSEFSKSLYSLERLYQEMPHPSNIVWGTTICRLLEGWLQGISQLVARNNLDEIRAIRDAYDEHSPGILTCMKATIANVMTMNPEFSLTPRRGAARCGAHAFSPETSFVDSRFLKRNCLAQCLRPFFQASKSVRSHPIALGCLLEFENMWNSNDTAPQDMDYPSPWQKRAGEVTTISKHVENLYVATSALLSPTERNGACQAEMLALHDQSIAILRMLCQEIEKR